MTAPLLYTAATFLWTGIPTGLIVTRLVARRDIRQVGSGNIGATNVRRILGWRWFLAVLLLDALKGALPLLLARRCAILPHHPAWPIAVTAAAILGNIFSPYLRFRGGKGVATSLGALAVLMPLPLLASAASFLLAFLPTGIISLGSLTAAATFPIWTFLILRNTTLTAFASCVAFLIAFSHRTNIQRLLRHQEPSVYEKNRKKT